MPAGEIATLLLLLAGAVSAAVLGVVLFIVRRVAIQRGTITRGARIGGDVAIVLFGVCIVGLLALMVLIPLTHR